MKMVLCLNMKCLGIHAEIFLPPWQDVFDFCFFLPGKHIDLEKQFKSSCRANMNVCRVPCVLSDLVNPSLLSSKHKHAVSLAN